MAAEPSNHNDHSELPLEEASDSPSDGDTFEWTVHPVKRRPVISVLVSIFIVLCGFIVNWSTGMPWFAGLAMVIMFASLAKFYFPTRYRLDSSGVMVKTTTQTLHKEWSMYRTYYRDRNGLLLSTFAAPSRLENFRGLYIIFDRNGDDVTEFVRKYVAEYQEPEIPGVEDAT